MMRRADYNLARMSGMLDLSRDEKAKHFLPVAIYDQSFGSGGRAKSPRFGYTTKRHAVFVV